LLVCWVDVGVTKQGGAALKACELLPCTPAGLLAGALLAAAFGRALFLLVALIISITTAIGAIVLGSLAA
jgi:hypothetical protein